MYDFLLAKWGVTWVSLSLMVLPLLEKLYGEDFVAGNPYLKFALGAVLLVLHNIPTSDKFKMLLVAFIVLAASAPAEAGRVVVHANGARVVVRTGWFRPGPIVRVNPPLLPQVQVQPQAPGPSSF